MNRSARCMPAVRFERSYRVFAFQVISSAPTGVRDPWSFLKSRQIIAARYSSKGESCP